MWRIVHLEHKIVIFTKRGRGVIGTKKFFVGNFINYWKNVPKFWLFSLFRFSVMIKYFCDVSYGTKWWFFKHAGVCRISCEVPIFSPTKGADMLVQWKILSKVKLLWFHLFLPIQGIWPKKILGVTYRTCLCDVSYTLWIKWSSIMG